MNFNFSIDNDSFIVDVSKESDSYDVSLDKDKYKVSSVFISGNEMLLNINGRKKQAHLFKFENTYYVCIDGAYFEIKDMDEDDSSNFESFSDSLSEEVTAPMPGKVNKMLVKPGDNIKSGQKIAILEAMKMENELISPRNGKISKVLFKEGDLVEAGKKIVEFE